MRKGLAVIFLVLAVGGIPDHARAQFCPGVSPWVFDDVLASDPFCGFITTMAQRNVSQGCSIIDANHRLYCPDANVSRKQMAAFMARLGDALLPPSCGIGQVLKWNGAIWACADDTAGGSGTVTSVTAGTGLQGSPNPITAAGSLSLAASYQLPQACSNGQVPKSNGSGAWTCAADATGSGTVTSLTAGTGLTGGVITTAGTIAVDATYVQRRVSASCAVGSSIRAIAADGTVTCQTDSSGPANAFVNGGNAFAQPASLGTLDVQSLTLQVGGQTALRLLPGTTPGVVGGAAANATAYTGVFIGGGGSTSTCTALNRPARSCAQLAGADFTSVGGGVGNWASLAYATVGGGYANTAQGVSASVLGGAGNYAMADGASVAGGEYNTANSRRAFVGGGYGNTASSWEATVGGGSGNTASGVNATVSGGAGNTASGGLSIVAGGQGSIATGQYSYAAGQRAKAQFAGCHVWSDNSYNSDTSCFAQNEFIARALGGFYFWTAGYSDATYSGARLAPGTGAWAAYSDRDGKHRVTPIDPQEILQKVAALPLHTWQWKAEPGSVRHMGPMAQDFHEAFGLGARNTEIVTIDADGVALAAIQGLAAKVNERDAIIAAMQSRIDELAAAVARLQASR